MSSPKRRQKRKRTVQSSGAITKKKPVTKPKFEPFDPDELFKPEKTTMANDKKQDEKDEKDTKSTKGGEKRSFQVGADPAEKTLLTKAEAEEKGFYWKEDDPAKTKGKD